MSKLDSSLNESQFYAKGTPQEKSGLGLKKSIERAMIVGGLLLTLLGATTVISSSSNFAEKKRLDTIENIVRYEEGSFSLRDKLVRKEEINNRTNPSAGWAGLYGFLGFFSLVLGAGYRTGRRHFEKYGFEGD